LAIHIKAPGLSLWALSEAIAAGAEKLREYMLPTQVPLFSAKEQNPQTAAEVQLLSKHFLLQNRFGPEKGRSDSCWLKRISAFFLLSGVKDWHIRWHRKKRTSILTAPR